MTAMAYHFRLSLVQHIDHAYPMRDSETNSTAQSWRDVS